MISYNAYKVLHLVGVFMILVSLGGLMAASAANAGRKSALHKLAMITNGIGLLVALVAGFGLIALLRLDWPYWVSGKILIWLLLAAMSALIRRHPESVSLYWWGALILASAGSYLAIYKPF